MLSFLGHVTVSSHLSPLLTPYPIRPAPIERLCVARRSSFPLRRLHAAVPRYCGILAVWYCGIAHMPLTKLHILHNPRRRLSMPVALLCSSIPLQLGGPIRETCELQTNTKHVQFPCAPRSNMHPSSPVGGAGSFPYKRITDRHSSPWFQAQCSIHPGQRRTQNKKALTDRVGSACFYGVVLPVILAVKKKRKLFVREYDYEVPHTGDIREYCLETLLHWGFEDGASQTASARITQLRNTHHISYYLFRYVIGDPSRSWGLKAITIVGLCFIGFLGLQARGYSKFAAAGQKRGNQHPGLDHPR